MVSPSLRNHTYTLTISYRYYIMSLITLQILSSVIVLTEEYVRCVGKRGITLNFLVARFIK